MAYNRSQAQKLCNATELELFVASLAAAVIQLTPAQLRSKVARTRNLRDKNADLFRRQVTSTRVVTGAKRSDTGTANQRTEQKTRLFEETLKRFETRLNKLDTQAAAPLEKRRDQGCTARQDSDPCLGKADLAGALCQGSSGQVGQQCTGRLASHGSVQTRSSARQEHGRARALKQRQRSSQARQPPMMFS